MTEIKELKKAIINLKSLGHITNKAQTDLETIANKIEKAINYTRCSTQLKVKEKPTFEEWIKKCGMQKVGNRIILKNNNQVSLGFMLEIYSGQINSGLL